MAVEQFKLIDDLGVAANFAGDLIMGDNNRNNYDDAYRRDCEVTKHGYGPGDVEFFSTPGSLEIPLVAKKLAKTGRYAAVCASGLIVDGGIYRHEFVANAVLQGIVQTSLETEVPVLSAVLTPHHFHEHDAHAGFFKAHMLAKGKELAEACVAIIERLSAVEDLT